MGNLSTVMVIAVAVRDDFLLNYLIAPLDAVFVHFARIERVQIIRVTLVTIFFGPLSVACRGACSCGSFSGCCSFLIVGHVL